MTTDVQPQRPRLFNVPNQLTAIRLLLSIVVFVLIAWQQYSSAFVVFVVVIFIIVHCALLEGVQVLRALSFQRDLQNGLQPLTVMHGQGLRVQDSHLTLNQPGAV